MGDDFTPVTPLTALVVAREGRLTYVGVDGRRYVIVADPALFERLQDLER